MKAPLTTAIHGQDKPQVHAALATSAVSESPAPTRRDLDGRGAPWTVATIYATHGEFVWRSLQRLGVFDTDLKDLSQEVFLVVHRRLDSFDGSALMTTWLFGICLRVVSDYRRRRRRRPESPLDPSLELEDRGLSPEQTLARREAQSILARVLDAMDLDKRAAFVMFEIEGVGCGEIAEVLGVPLGTVYSRLHAARAQFQKNLNTHRGE